jgi:hypothetical protein
MLPFTRSLDESARETGDSEIFTHEVIDLFVTVVSTRLLPPIGGVAEPREGKIFNGLPCFLAVNQNSTFRAPSILENSCEASTPGCSEAQYEIGIEFRAEDVLSICLWGSPNPGTAHQPSTETISSALPDHSPCGPTHAIRWPQITMSQFCFRE